MEENNITDMVEVKGKIGRIENHLGLLKQAQLDSDKMHVENSKKLDLLVNTFTDSPFNADNGLVKRFNKIEKIVETHVLYFQICIGTISGGLGLWFIINVLFKQ